MQNPNQTSYDSLVSLADSKEKRDMITKNADPKLEKFKLENQTVAIANLMNTYLKNPIDSNTLSQFTKLGARGAEAVFGLFYMEIKRRQGNKDKRIELAYKLIEMESDETMGEDERNAIMNMKLLGMQLLEKEGILDKQQKEKQKVYSDVDVNLAPRFDIASVKDFDEIDFYGDKMTGRQFKSDYGNTKFTKDDLNNLKINRQKLTFAGAAGWRRFSRDMSPVKIATSEEINKAARKLGFNEKVLPGSAKYKSIKKRLEKMFPSYNFGVSN